MSDEPTPGELRRLYEQLREDTRRGFESVNERLDKMPTSELFMAHLNAWQRQLDNTDAAVINLRRDVEKELAERDAQREADQKRYQWLVSGVVVPCVLALLAFAVSVGWIG